MIIWVASYPRSGNTLVRILLHHALGLRSCSVFGDPLFSSEGSSETVGHVELPASIEELARRPELYLVKTHRLEDASTPHPALHVVRDGRDALVSCAHYQQRYGDPSWVRVLRDRLPSALRRALFQRALRNMLTDTRFGGWSHNVVTWRDRGARTAVIRYEELLERPIESLRAACASLGIQTSDPPHAEPPTFSELRKRWPGFFRRGVVGAWRDEMPEPLHREFWRLHGDAMRVLGYA